jgi:hypothetical protein
MANNTRSLGYSTVSAVVKRADGTVEDLGVISIVRPRLSIFRRLWTWLTLQK